jgi:pyruvate dehydrogenase E1 component beta subunit
LDEAAILAVARETGRIVVLTEASRPCSIASEVVSLLATDAFDALKASPRIVASPHQPQPPSAFQGEFFPDEDQVVDAVRAVL